MSTLQQILCVHDKSWARKFLMLALMPCWLAGCSASLVRPEVYAISMAAPVHRSEGHEVSTAVPVHRVAEISPRRLRAMLAPPAAPNCEFKGSDADAVDANLFARLKLDYERHCYQHAEALVRSRLRQLQVSSLCEASPLRRRQRFMRIAPAF